MQSLDLLGLRERKSNRMADADLQRQLQLMKLAEELDRETGGITSKRKMDEETAKTDLDIKKALSDHYKLSPEEVKTLTPAVRDAMMAKIQSEKNTTDANIAHQTGKLNAGLSPDYQKEVAGSVGALLAQPGVKNTADLRMTAGPGTTTTQPVNGPGLASIPGINNMLSATGATETQIPGEPIVLPNGMRIPGKPFNTTIPGGVKFPADFNKRSSGPGLSTMPDFGQPVVPMGNNPAALSPNIVPDSTANFNLDTGFKKPALNAMPESSQFRGLVPSTIGAIQDLPQFPSRIAKGYTDYVGNPVGEWLKYILFGQNQQ